MRTSEHCKECLNPDPGTWEREEREAAVLAHYELQKWSDLDLAYLFKQHRISAMTFAVEMAERLTLRGED